MAALHVHARLPICIPRMNWRSVSTLGQHTNYFRNPRILADAVPLGFCSGGFSSTAGLRLRQRSSTFIELPGSLWRVLSKEPLLAFLRVAQENLAASSSRAFQLRLGRHRINSPPVFPLGQRVTTSATVPLSVSKAVTLVTGRFIREGCFKIKFLGVLSSRRMTESFLRAHLSRNC